MPYVTENTDMAYEVSYENKNKNDYFYTLDHIDGPCLVTLSFELYKNGFRIRSFENTLEYIDSEKNRKIDLGLTVVHPIINVTGDDQVLFALTHDSFTEEIFIENIYDKLTNYSVEKHKDFSIEEDTEYDLLTFYSGKIPDFIYSSDDFDRKDFLINNCEYVYFVTTKFSYD